jgi:hypothetical protein
VAEIPIPKDILKGVVSHTARHGVAKLFGIKLLILVGEKVCFIQTAEMADQHGRLSAIVFNACLGKRQADAVVGHGYLRKMVFFYYNRFSGF